MSWLRFYDDSVVIAPGEVEFFICDDCRNAYLGPVYYSFDSDGCTTEEVTPDGMTNIQHDNSPDGPCTGNLCHDCAGDDTYPDDEEDPRWDRPAHL